MRVETWGRGSGHVNTLELQAEDGDNIKGLSWARGTRNNTGVRVGKRRSGD